MQTPLGGYWVLVAQDRSSQRPLTKQEATTSAMTWVAVMIVGVIALFGVWMWLRKTLLAPKADSEPGSIMEDLRRMRDQGQMTQEEYDNVRKNMAQRLAKGGFGEEKKPAAGPGAGPGGSKSR
jgi:hypothetical protein